MRIPCLVSTLAVAATSLGLVACGGSSNSTTTVQAGGGGARAAFSDPKVAACLKQHGVTVPTGRRGQGGSGGRPSGTTPVAPPSTTGTNPQRPPGATGRRGFPGANSAQFQKLRAAMKACGVTVPNGGPGPGGAGPGGAPGAASGQAAS
jgi:hypothetical protein